MCTIKAARVEKAIYAWMSELFHLVIKTYKVFFIDVIDNV